MTKAWIALADLWCVSLPDCHRTGIFTNMPSECVSFDMSFSWEVFFDGGWTD